MGTGDILFGKTRGGLLALLYEHPNESFYIRRIIRHLQAGPGAVQRELKALEKAGLISRRTAGSMVFYQANENSPIFQEMRSLVSKTVGMVEVLRRVLQPLSKKIRVAFVYGSVARKDEGPQSDIDVMVVGDVPLEEIMTRLNEAESKLGRALNPTVYGVAEFRAKISAKNHFVSAVLRGSKEFLIGSEDELRKVGRVRLA
jgi:predicted nucleotidyltransferase